MSNTDYDTRYDVDVVAWSERQAKLLRRVADGDLVNDQVDWPHVVEEIEAVGNEQRHAVESLLTNIMQHLLQIGAWPKSLAVPHWRHEINSWRVQLDRRLRRGPKLRTDAEASLAELYRDAIKQMYREVDGVPRPPVPASCPFSLAQLLTSEADEDAPED